MAHIERAEAVKRLKTALRKGTGRAWRVYGNAGTSYGWITIHAPAARCTNPEFGGYLSDDDRALLGRIFHEDNQPVHQQGYDITPDNRAQAVQRAEEYAR